MDGLLNIDKPKGITSYGVVSRIKRILKVKKVGHTGTLDPDAEGVLVICINKATKVVQFLSEVDKEYEGVLQLGVITDTLDASGKIMEENKNYELPEQQIKDTFSKFVGKIKQIPPIFSAVKYQGERSYKLARAGKQINLKPRERVIYSLEILNIDIPYVTFKVKCSTGTYIRQLCSDIGKLLECGACLFKLKRLMVGSFDIDKAISLEDLERIYEEGSLHNVLCSIDEALNHFPAVIVNSLGMKKVSHGISLMLEDIIGYPKQICEGEKVRICTPDSHVIAVANSLLDNGRIVDAKPDEVVFKMVRVFQN